MIFSENFNGTTGGNPTGGQFQSGLPGRIAGAVDNFSVTAVPEPSTVALLGAGATLLSLIRLRRRTAEAAGPPKQRSLAAGSLSQWPDIRPPP